MSVVQLENICMNYGSKVVLHNASLSVAPGELLCLMGESVSGKTTLLNIIGLLETPVKGRISVFGHSGLKPSSAEANIIRREKIGFLFQNYGLIDSESINYNLDIVRGRRCREESFNNEKQDILSHLGISKINPKTKVYKLSGGEQQRIALARLLLKKAELILCDEPTGSLDSHNSKQVMALLSKLNQEGKTVIIVTHDLRIALQCKRMVYLQNGKLADTQ